MAVIKVKDSTSKNIVSSRQKRTTKFGRGVVRLFIDEEKAGFTIHEDLLCLNSEYFRREIQPKRKPIEDDSDKNCPICIEPLEPGVNELTYCVARCGHNFHLECVETWLKEQPAHNKLCSACREPWINERLASQPSFPILTTVGFSVYQEWLYHEEICITNDEGTNDFKVWLEAYLLGAQVEDNAFCDAVLEASLKMYADSDVDPPCSFIERAYINTVATSPLRKFLVVMEIKIHDRLGLIGDLNPILPGEYLADIANELFDFSRKGKECWIADNADTALWLNVDHASGLKIHAHADVQSESEDED